MLAIDRTLINGKESVTAIFNIYLTLFVNCLFYVAGNPCIENLESRNISKANPGNVTNGQYCVHEYRALKKDILTRDQAVLKIPPFASYAANSSKITFESHPRQVMSVSNDAQTVHLKAWFDVGWRDPEFSWEPEDHGGWNYIKTEWTPDGHEIWTPRFSLLEGVDATEFTVTDDVIIYHNGQMYVSMDYTGQFECSLDTYWFPYDAHVCQMTFSWADEFRLELPDVLFADDFRNINAEWNVTKYECMGTNNNEIACHLHISRNGAFYLVNIMLPMFMTHFATSFVFLLPVGEKISYLTNIFISTSVFLAFIIDILPTAMEKVNF